MSAPPDVLDLAYVGVLVGSMVLLAILWRLLPKLFGAEAAPARPRSTLPRGQHGGPAIGPLPCSGRRHGASCRP